MDFLEGRPGTELGCYKNDSGQDCQVSGPERCKVLQLCMAQKPCIYVHYIWGCIYCSFYKTACRCSTLGNLNSEPL
jgi:hypothetical protein